MTTIFFITTFFAFSEHDYIDTKRIETIMSEARFRGQSLQQAIVDCNSSKAAAATLSGQKLSRGCLLCLWPTDMRGGGSGTFVVLSFSVLPSAGDDRVLRLQSLLRLL